MSDLRERLMLVATDFNEWGHIRTPDQVVAASLPIIEAELQKRDRLRDQINDAYVRTEASLTGANKLLEQTIEVLEEMQRISLWALDGVSSYLQSGAQECLVQSTKAYVDQTRNEIRRQAKPLLDNLKARKP